MYVGKEGETIQDEIIIRQVLSGDRNAFRMLVDKYQPYLFQVVYGVLRHAKDAEDVTQEVLVKLYQALPQYRSDGFKTWMTRIAVNRAIDFRRSLLRKKEQLSDTPEDEMLADDSATVEEPFFQREAVWQVRRLLEELPDVYKDVVKAYYIEEKSYRQIAAEHGVALKTVESQLYRAKQWIRKNWKEEDFG